LDEFYEQHALRQTEDEWFSEHPYDKSVWEDEVDVWMAK
jgi:hypothetical protein